MIRVLAVALTLLLLAASDAMACTLAATRTPRQRVHAAKLAVYVEVVSARTVETTADGVSTWEATVRRLKTFKGRPAAVFRVHSETDRRGGCHLSMFQSGERVGLLLDGPGPPFHIGLGSTITLSELRRARRH